MTDLVIKPLTTEEPRFKAELATLLAQTWPESYQKTAAQEVDACLADERVALMAMMDNQLVGFVGAMPQYGTTGWELHPLVVAPDYQGNHIGALLLNALEQALIERGAVTVYLGSDDEEGKTSLANVDLYEDTFAKIRDVQNIAHHPYEFYQKQGYQIVGVIPDANGIGKPDIWLAKRLVK